VQYANAALKVTATGLSSGEVAERAFMDAAIVISANTNWSAITTGSGVGGQPTAADSIVVNNGVTLTIDVANAVAGGVTLGNNTAGTATLTFSGSNRKAVFNTLVNSGTANVNISSTNIVCLGDSTNFTYSGTIGPNASAGTLLKAGTGTMTLTGTSTFAGTVGVGQGTLTLSGASGTMTSAAFTVNHDGKFILDNTSNVVTNRISTTNNLTMSGGEFVLQGGTGALYANLGVLLVESADSTVTVIPGSGGAVANFASIVPSDSIARSFAE